MDFLISQVPATTNAVRQEQELRNNAGVLLLNGINNNLNVKQHLMHHQQQQQHRQHQQHLHHQQVQQKMTKKKLKLAQTQLDKLTQINIHLHGTYYFSIIFFLCIISIIIFVRFNRLFCVVPIFFCVLTRQRSNQQYLLLYSLTHYTLLCFFFVICFRRPLCYRLGIVPISETHVRSTHWNLSLSLNRFIRQGMKGMCDFVYGRRARDHNFPTVHAPTAGREQRNFTFQWAIANETWRHFLFSTNANNFHLSVHNDDVDDDGVSERLRGWEYQEWRR